MARWGLAYDPGQHLLTVAPRLGEEPPAAAGPFRAGRTVVVLELRERPAAVALRVSIGFGPAIRIAARLEDEAGAVAAEVDGVPLGRAEVGFEASSQHEVIWRR